MNFHLPKEIFYEKQKKNILKKTFSNNLIFNKIDIKQNKSFQLILENWFLPYQMIWLLIINPLKKFTWLCKNKNTVPNLLYPLPTTYFRLVVPAASEWLIGPLGIRFSVLWSTLFLKKILLNSKLFHNQTKY